ncbi:hypothetical protein JTB14_021078 [Gonioctena quinquepunctata]|nr:hypothetical protein JTB14_021078 [Gonioctena quinquepunctata]
MKFQAIQFPYEIHEDRRARRPPPPPVEELMIVEEPIRHREVVNRPDRLPANQFVQPQPEIEEVVQVQFDVRWARNPTQNGLQGNNEDPPPSAIPIASKGAVRKQLNNSRHIRVVDRPPANELVQPLLEIEEVQDRKTQKSLRGEKVNIPPLAIPTESKGAVRKQLMNSKRKTEKEKNQDTLGKRSKLDEERKRYEEVMKHREKLWKY